HLESTWRKYMHFGLNLGRNGTRLHLYSKTLEVLFQIVETASTFLVTPLEHSRDDVKISPDDVKLTDSEEARQRFAG
ncbi:hypothetical protein Tco_0048477, partial [Tanacetum coccineum]